MEEKHLTNDLLLDLLEGNGSADARDHLADCATCRAELETLKPIRRDFSDLADAGAPKPNDELIRRIVGRLGAGSHRRVYRRRATPWRWVAGGAAAAAAVLAIVLSVQKPVEPPPVETAVTPSPEIEVKPEPKITVPIPPPEIPAPKSEPKSEPKAATKPTPKPKPQPDPKPVPKPAPKPEPKSEPKPAPEKPKKTEPKKTEPKPVFVMIAKLEGGFERRLEERWSIVDGESKIRWSAVNALRSRSRVARFTLADGSRVTLWPRSEVRLMSATPLTLELDKGRVYCEVPPEKGRSFRIATPDAQIAVTGTRFSVRRHSDHTEVIVSDGEVAVANARGKSLVPAGTGLNVRKSRAPGKPRIVDADSMLSWSREAGPRQRSLFRFGFENGKRPYPWTSGTVEPGPARGINRRCIRLDTNSLAADLSRVDRRHTVYRKNLLIRVRFYATGGNEFWIQFFSEQAKDNFRYHLKGISTGKWETFELPLSKLYLLSNRSARLKEGDRLTWLTMGVSGPTGPVYFDDIELVEVQP